MSEPIAVAVTTSSRDYEVVVGKDLLGSLGERVKRAVHADTAFVVTDSNVGPLYLDRALASLDTAGLATASITLPAGEQHKTLTSYGAILDAMAHAGLTRDDVVVALGGGVVGDMAGFAAATYMRGIEVVQVPTTLLSMVDSSVGGKTAIDVAAGKNLVGAFLQPSLVVADIACLSTLTPYVFADGMGEVVKHAVLADSQLFGTLSERPLTQDTDSSYLVEVVAANVRIKRDVVATDERERGLRQTLNLGHTIGHAIEAASGYTQGHGHCVAAGLCCVTRATEQLGWSEAGLATRIERCCLAQGLPIDSNIPHEDILHQATFDKKRHGDSVNLVVPTRVGKSEVRRTSLGELSRIVELGCGTGMQESLS
jgi:3-dehydroquinate synthase